MRNLYYIICICSLFCLFGCHKDDEQPSKDIRCKITLMMDPNGLGDLGNNDLIYQGVENFCNIEKSIDKTLVVPSDWNDALTQIKNWQSDTLNGNTRRLLILANENYGQLIETLNLQNSSNSQVLLVGGLDTCYNVYTRSISMYGISYWVGLVTAQLFKLFKDSSEPSFYLLAANDKDKNMIAGVDGFIDGVQTMWGNNTNACVVDYVSHEANGGYTDFEKMYKILGNRPQNINFIYPLLNGNNMPLLYYFLQNEADMYSSTENQIFFMSGTGFHNELVNITGFVLYSIFTDYSLLMQNFLSYWYNQDDFPMHKIECFDSYCVHFSCNKLIDEYVYLEDTIFESILTKERLYLYEKE